MSQQAKHVYLRKIPQYFWHFISSFTTTNIDNNIRVRKLGQWLWDDSFSTAKGSWDCCCSALNTTKMQPTTTIIHTVYMYRILRWTNQWHNLFKPIKLWWFYYSFLDCSLFGKIIIWNTQDSVLLRSPTTWNYVKQLFKFTVWCTLLWAPNKLFLQVSMTSPVNSYSISIPKCSNLFDVLHHSC